MAFDAVKLHRSRFSWFIVFVATDSTSDIYVLQTTPQDAISCIRARSLGITELTNCIRYPLSTS